MGVLAAALEEASVDQERKQAIGRRMRTLRTRSPYTQEQVADILGITVRGYQKAEQTGMVKHERLERLAELYDVDVDAFYEPVVMNTDDRLERIEEKLDALLSALGVDLESETDPGEQMKALLADAASQQGRKPTRTARSTNRAAGARD